MIISEGSDQARECGLCH